MHNLSHFARLKVPRLSELHYTVTRMHPTFLANNLLNSKKISLSSNNRRSRLTRQVLQCPIHRKSLACQDRIPLRHANCDLSFIKILACFSAYAAGPLSKVCSVLLSVVPQLRHQSTFHLKNQIIRRISSVSSRTSSDHRAARAWALTTQLVCMDKTFVI